MAEGTRSQDIPKFEESFRNTMKEHQEQVNQELESLQSMVMELGHQLVQKSPQESRLPSASNDGTLGSSRNSQNYFALSRFTKVEFPRFNGEDYRSWLVRCEQFFDVDETPSHIKVKLAVIHLEGKALQCSPSIHEEKFDERIARMGRVREGVGGSGWQQFVR